MFFVPSVLPSSATMNSEPGIRSTIDSLSLRISDSIVSASLYTLIITDTGSYSLLN